MTEKRRSERLDIKLYLSISDIFDQDNSGIHGIEAPIKVINISQHGIGFLSECILPLEYYFNAKVTINDLNPTIFTVVKIIRCDVIEKNYYQYGCEFPDLPESLAHLLD